MDVFQQSLHPTQGQSPGSLAATTGGFCHTGRASRARPRSSPAGRASAPRGRARGGSRGLPVRSCPAHSEHLTPGTAQAPAPETSHLPGLAPSGRSGAAAAPGRPPAPRVHLAGSGRPRSQSGLRPPALPPPQRRAGPAPWVLTSPRRPRERARPRTDRGAPGTAPAAPPAAGGDTEQRAGPGSAGAGLPAPTRAWSGAGEAGGVGVQSPAGGPGRAVAALGQCDVM